MLIHSSIIPPPPPFNLSHFLYPKVTAFTESNVPLQPPQFSQRVLDEIANKEKWALEDIRVSELDVKKAKYRTVQRYDFRVRVGKIEFALKMYDKASEWKKLVGIIENRTSNFEALARRIGSTAVIDSFKVEGPLELMVVADDDRLSLMLPLNTSHFGLRRVLVGEGITVEVKGAENISMFRPSDYQFLYGIFSHRGWNDVRSVWPALCTRSLPIRVRGSATMVAYRNRRPGALIQTAFRSTDAIELLPERCYVRPNYDKSMQLHNSLRTRIALLKRVLRSLVNEADETNAALGSVKVRIRAFPMYRFPLELERNIRSNDSYWSTLGEWRTRPATERVRFEVEARFEGGVLKPLLIKKTRPFMDTDSFTWSSLSSNVSFTMLPPLLVPPESLTLDVKW